MHHSPRQQRDRTPITGPGSDRGLAAALEQQCRAASAVAGLAGAVVTLMAPDGGQAVAGSSDEPSRAWEELQFAVGEGPGIDAFAAGQPVLVPDVASETGRWPGYVPQAVTAGAGAVFVLPLQLGAARFGVLSCYSDRPRVLVAGELVLLLDLAETVTRILLATADADPDGGPDRARHDLDGALNLRDEIYQAQGIVTVQLGVGLAEALARMRAHAFAAELDLVIVALGIVDGTVRLRRNNDHRRPCRPRSDPPEPRTSK